MATLQGTASFAAFGLFEALYTPGAARVGDGDRLLMFNKAPNSVSGVSAPDAWASAPPGGDPAVLARQAALIKSQGNQFP
jgi:hypothetical protein